MKYLSLLICVMSLSFLSCKMQSDELIGKWTHAREQDHDGLQVYIKGENPDLPPARFREVMIFNEEGKCEFLNLAANDAHRLDDAHYSVKDNKVSVSDEEDKLLYEFKIISLKEDVLTLKLL